MPVHSYAQLESNSAYKFAAMISPVRLYTTLISDKQVFLIPYEIAIDKFVFKRRQTKKPTRQAAGRLQNCSLFPNLFAPYINYIILKLYWRRPLTTVAIFGTVAVIGKLVENNFLQYECKYAVKFHCISVQCRTVL